VPELLLSGTLRREHLGRQEPLEQVVIAPVAVSPCEAEDAGERVRLEDRLDGIGRHTEPVGRGAALALEVERRHRALGADRPSTRSATSAFSAKRSRRRVLAHRRAKRRELFVGTKESPLLYASKISRRS
jgi:hypothetical protein